MAEPRQPGPSGPAPVDTINAGPGMGVQAAGDPRAVKVDMGQGPPPRPVSRPPQPARGGGASILLSSVLALLFGGVGAWAYERFLARPLSSDSTVTTTSPTGRDPEARQEVVGLEDRINNLSDRYNKLDDEYKQLRSRVETLPKTTAASDLGPIESKVARVDSLSQQVDAIDKKVNPLPEKFEEYDRRIADLDEKLEDLRHQAIASRIQRPGGQNRQVTLTRHDRPNSDLDIDEGRDAAERPATRPAPDSTTADGKPLDLGIDSGMTLFRKGDYSQAYAIFRDLLQVKPEDARVWYYAALAYGLATGEWEGVTRTMVEQGVAREKAGKPSKSEIDSAFGGLTQETGKEWLAFYRRHAG